MNRSNNRANTNGGVAYSNANNDSGTANANYGSRLANNVNYDELANGRRTCPPAAPRGTSHSNSRKLES